MILLSISLFFACYRYCGAPQSAVRRNKITKKTLPFSCWAASFFVFRGALGQLRIHISLVSRFETADKTVVASRNESAMLNFAPHPIVFPLRGRCRLRQMRCNYIRAVGATLLTDVSILPELKSIAVGAIIDRPILIMFLPDGKD